MKFSEGQRREQSAAPADDEVGKPIWKTPEPAGKKSGEDEDEDDDDDEPGEGRPVPPTRGENEIHAPGFDPLQQREWEERERRRREEEAERERRENPRGIWEM
ncbi:hypothetical protein EBS80_04405 [bacterium]|nr:hypothetical protein [bacterium]